MKTRIEKRQSIKYRIRKKLSGTAYKPRLTVFKSNTSIYCQLIDDEAGKTICSASSKGLSSTKSDQAREVGKIIAQKAAGVQISNVVFDRNGYIYHGRVKALAEGAREGGLNF